MEKKTLNKKLVILFLLALVLRIGFILTLDNTVDIWGDWWDELGWKIATGQGFWVNNPYFPDGVKFYSWRAPGFPLFLAGIYRIFGHSYLAAKIGLAVLSALSCILLFYLASEVLKNKTAGFWCALIYAVYPPSIFWTGYLAPETLTTFLLTCSVFLTYISIKKNNFLLYFFIGFLWGFLILTRPNFLMVVPFLFLFVLFYKIKFKNLLIITFGLCIPLSIWCIRNYKIHHKFVLISTEGGIVFYIANNEYAVNQPSGFYHAENIDEIKGLSEVEIDRKFYKDTISFIKRNPKLYLQLVIDRFLRFWRFFPHTFSGPGESYKFYHQIISFLTECPIIIFGFLGFLFSFKNWKKFFLIDIVIIIFSIVNILVRTTIRYRFPIMGFLIILCLYFFEKIKHGKEHI